MELNKKSTTERSLENTQIFGNKITCFSVTHRPKMNSEMNLESIF